jgi:aminoglycoside phosphotransferase (APT) family kinase protein
VSARVPVSLDELTPAWLTEILSGHGLDKVNRVTSIESEPLGGERGIAAQLWRLRLRYEVGSVELPATVIAKFPPADSATRAQLSAMGFFEREIGFFQALAAETPIPTPRCYFAGLESGTGAALLVIEDLGQARNGDTIRGCSVEEVAQVLSALAELHAAWWQHPTVTELPWLRLTSMLAPSATADVFAQAWPSFLKKLSSRVSDEIFATGRWIGRQLPEAAATLLETGPRTLIHNDVQADNLFFTDQADRAVVFCDWQMVTCARGVVDVAGIIRGHLDPELRRAVEPDLVLNYHAALLAAGVRDYPLEQCKNDYELATVLAPARLASAVGMHPGLQPHPGAFWDLLFPRYFP